MDQTITLKDAGLHKQETLFIQDRWQDDYCFVSFNFVYVFLMIYVLFYVHIKFTFMTILLIVEINWFIMRVQIVAHR